MPTLGTRVMEANPGPLFTSPDGSTVVTLLDGATPLEKSAPRDISVGSLAVVPVEGGNPQVVGSGVTSMPGAFRFNSSGSHLAFLADYRFSKGSGELRLSHLGSEKTESLGEEVSFYTFSPDGSKIVWISDGKLFLRASSGGETEEIASDIYTAQLGPPEGPAEDLMLIKRSARSDGGLLLYDFRDGSLEGIAHSVTAFGFAPNGSAFAFQGAGLLAADDIGVLSPFDRIGEKRERRPGLYMAAIGQKPLRVASSASDFIFSPVGSTLAYISPPEQGAANGDLHVAELDGESRRVAPRVARMLYGPDGTLALLGAFDPGSGLGTLGLLPPEGELVEVSRNVKLFGFSPQGRHITYSYIDDFGAGYGIGLGTRPVSAPAEVESRKVDSGVFGWMVSPDDRFLAYKARCEYRGRACELFVLPLDSDPEVEARSITDKVAAFDYLGDGRTLAVIRSRPADRSKIRLTFSLGTIPVTGGDLTLLDDGLAGDFVTAGKQFTRLAYAVDAPNRSGIYLIDAKR